MYTWLVKEIEAIKTRRYHLTHLPSSSESQDITRQKLLPPSYLKFTQQFGQSRLYRSGTSYMLHVYETPYVELQVNNEAFVQFGTIARLTRVCFKLGDLSIGKEAPVFELLYIDGEYDAESTDLTFDLWLFKSANEIKDAMDEDDWNLIQKGPPPFTERELQIIEERKNFIYSLVGFTDSGEAEIFIKSHSQIVLPYLSIGAKRKATNKPPQTIWLPIHDLKPGESRVITHDIYKKFIHREELELVDLPDPEPEDREVYWEFKRFVP